MIGCVIQVRAVIGQTYMLGENEELQLVVLFRFVLWLVRPICLEKMRNYDWLCYLGLCCGWSDLHAWRR